MRAVRVAALFVFSFAFTQLAHAAPPTGYACPPGVPDKGVGCKCPGGYTSKVDDGIALCAPGGGAKRPPPPKLTYDQLLSRANGLADSDCKTAEIYYAQALQQKPNGIEALVGSGMCHIDQRKWASAHSRFRSALAIDARYEGALWGVAEAYRLQGKKDDAIAAYKQYLDIYPGSYKGKAALDKLGGRGTVEERVVTGKFPARTSEVAIAVTSGITVQGKQLSPSSSMSDIIAILGKPDRLWNVPNGINQVHTWDKLGVIAYEPMENGKGSGRLLSLTVHFKKSSMDYAPATNFAGSYTVDGSKLSASTTLAEANRRPGATQPYGPGSVVFPKGGFNVFMNSANNTTLDLIELSMWKAPQKAPDVDTTTGGGGKVASTRDMKIAVTGNRIVMNNTAISGKPRVADLEAIYGKPDRVWDQGTGNKVYTWDKLGLVGYEPRDHPGRLISATFPFKPMGVGYDPKTMFGGSIIVDGNAMRSSDTIANVKTWPGATQPYSGSSIVFDKGDLHVFTIGKGAGLDLVELSFWQQETAQPPPQTGKPATTQAITVAIVGSRVTINGTAISGKPMVADLQAILGKPDRTWDTKGSVNKVHTWDKLGVLVYEPHDGRAISVTFPFEKLGAAFDPKTMFGGKITVDGAVMDANTMLGTLKKRSGSSTPYGADSVVFDKGDIHVFSRADDDGEVIELVELGFWQKDKKP